MSAKLVAINALTCRSYYYDTETGFYYLQSRYYDPVTHRFINADSYASTDATDAIACNMFAYCGNNPANCSDPSGCRCIFENDCRYYGNGCVAFTDTGTGTPELLRDVTSEINDAILNEICVTYTMMGNFFKERERYEPVLLYSFYTKVKDRAPWDIKREQQWTNTIGTSFPGQDTKVIYCGIAVTPHNLGNYTYGCLGRAYGFDLETLLFGSEYAAGFPESGTAEWYDEVMNDQIYIIIGYYCGPDW